MFACLAWLSLAAPHVVSAQPTPPEEARTLFTEATDAMRAGAFAEACPKLERVMELVPEGIGAKIALADCYVGIGRLASAQRAYVAAEAAAAAANQPERQVEARAKSDALAPRLAKLTLELSPAVRDLPDLGVSRDGVPIGAAELGLPVAMDAGRHVIVVVARDREPREERVDLVDGESRVVSVDALTPKIPAVDLGPRSGPTQAPPRRAPVPFWSGQRVAGLVVGLGGVASLGVGTAFGILTKTSVDESNDLGCDADTAVCPTQEALDVRRRALTFAHVSTGTLVGGGVLLATGVLVFATAPSGDTEVALGPGAVELRGRF